MPTILIVDDEFGLAETLSDVLVTMGYEVTTAVNGKLALASVRATRPDAVLLDVMMPVMSGLEMLAQLRADDAYRDLPVILMSATAPETLLDDLRDAKTSFLQKPFTFTQLMAALREFLGRPLE